MADGISISCPKCGGEVVLPWEWKDPTGQCPECNVWINIPPHILEELKLWRQRRKQEAKGARKKEREKRREERRKRKVARHEKRRKEPASDLDGDDGALDTDITDLTDMDSEDISEEISEEISAALGAEASASGGSESAEPAASPAPKNKAKEGPPQRIVQGSGTSGVVQDVFKREQAAINSIRLIARINLWASAAAFLILAVVAVVLAIRRNPFGFGLFGIGFVVVVEGAIVWAFLTVLSSIAANLVRIRQLTERTFDLTMVADAEPEKANDKATSTS